MERLKIEKRSSMCALLDSVTAQLQFKPFVFGGPEERIHKLQIQSWRRTICTRTRMKAGDDDTKGGGAGGYDRLL